MKRILSFSTFLIFLFSTQNYSQNKVSQSKSELKSSSSKSGSGSGTSSKGSSDDDDYDTSLIEMIAFGIFKYGLIGDYRHEKHLNSDLSPYPFYNNVSGNFQNINEDSIKSYIWRLDIENHFIYSDNNLFGNHLKATYRPFQYFYFQGDYRQIFEKNKLTDTSDNLSLFHLNISYDRIRFERFNFGWNIGASYVGNEVKKAGFSYGLSMDFFMNKRLSFSGAAKWSQINGHPVNAYEFQTKYYKTNYYFSLGYEHLKIASPKYNFIAVGGGIHF